MSLAAIQDSEVTRLRRELAAAHGRERIKDGIISNLSRAVAELTEDCPPWAPSLAICYSKWADARRAQAGWRQVWNCIRWLIADLGDLPAPLLTPLRWDEFRSRCRLRTTMRGEPPCEATLNLYLVYSKAMLNFAVERGMIRRNPLALAKPVPTVTRRETRLTPGDLEKLLEAADDVINRRVREGDDDGSRAKLLKAFCLCIFDSMLRFTEARTLKLCRIEPDGSYELLGSETKNGKPRWVKLTSRTLEAIGAIPRPENAVYVFEDAKGLVTDNRLREYFRRACELSGVDARATPRDRRIRPHDARAGGATAADEAGARPTAIRDVLGHMDLRTTQVYLRSDKRDSAAVVWEEMERIGPKRAGSSRKLKKDLAVE